MLKPLLVLTALLSVALAASKCKGGIPKAEAAAFLKIHNALRTKISNGKYVVNGTRKMPAAKTAIPKLTWDCSIEKSAQAVANTCVFAHSKNRTNLGENLFTLTSTKNLTFTGMGKMASDLWESEFQKYNWKDIKLTLDVFNTGIGHATQMAWAKSTLLGCGMKLCNGGKQIIVACQYRNAGNVLNTNIYEPKA